VRGSNKRTQQRLYIISSYVFRNPPVAKKWNFHLGLLASASVSFGPVRQAVHCGGVLTLLDQRSGVATLRLPDYFAHLVAQGCNVLVWAWDRAWLVGGRGDLLWSGTFPRRIGSAFADELGFSILAGQLYRFRVEKRGPYPKTQEAPGGLTS
jgi:hypothetical protein